MRVLRTHLLVLWCGYIYLDPFLCLWFWWFRGWGSRWVCCTLVALPVEFLKVRIVPKIFGIGAKRERSRILANLYFLPEYNPVTRKYISWVWVVNWNNAYHARGRSVLVVRVQRLPGCWPGMWYGVARVRFAPPWPSFGRLQGCRSFWGWGSA